MDLMTGLYNYNNMFSYIRKGSEKHGMHKRKHDDRSVNASKEDNVKASEKR
jgi:hypothetical protein